MELNEIIESLHFLADPELVKKREVKFGISNTNGLGISHKDLNQIAKNIGYNKDLALTLWRTNIYEAKLLCSKCFPPNELTNELAETWVKTFNNWEICDAFSQNIISKSPLALTKIKAWTSRKGEFEKRAGFATMASYSYAHKKEINKVFMSFFSIIESSITDNRLYTKKAVNWAIRSIGKRNEDLRDSATSFCYKMNEKYPNDKACSWIIKDALRELEKDTCKIMDYPRETYRP